MPFVVVLFACLYGTLNSKIDSNVLSLYSEESRFIQSIRALDEKMSGSSSVVLYMDFGKDYAMQDPEVLRVIDDLQTTLSEKNDKYVVTTSSLVDVVKDTYQKLNEGREDKYAIPDDRRQLAHTLYMFNNAAPEERSMLVGDAYRVAAVTITLLDGSSYEYNEVFKSMKEDVNRALEEIKINYPEAFISVTGSFALRMKVSEYLTATALYSFGIAFAVINILLFFIFGSFKAGLISLIPNLIPSVIIIGLMGLLSVPLDFFAIMLAPIIIGISVDDTIHFLSHYRTQYLKYEDIHLALKNTLKEAGQGVLFTTIVLGVGFSILSLSSTPGAVKLGTFGPIAIFAGLLNDLFLLPALIILFKLKFKNTENEKFSKGA
jgi:predicted RND superfamily exporter protein